MPDYKLCIKKKYLECKCCGFLSVILKKDSHKDLICPHCYSMGCKEGKFIELSVMEFINKAEIQI